MWALQRERLGTISMLRGGEDQCVGFLPLSLVNFDTEKLNSHRIDGELRPRLVLYFPPIAPLDRMQLH